MLILLFASIMLLTTLASPECADDTVIFKGKKYTIVKDKPKNSDCKGDEVLRDESGEEFCIAKTTDPKTSGRLECDNSRYAECGRENPPGKNTARIVNGSPVEGIRFPWLAFLHDLDFRCTGSILSSSVIVFAGHCFISSIAKAIVGVNDTRSVNALTIYFGRVVIHPNYSPSFNTSFENDIAVMITFRPIEFNKNVGPICLPEAETFDMIGVGTVLTVVGYGEYKTLESITKKYNLVKTKQMGREEFAEVDLAKVKTIAYETLAELLPNLPQILDQNLDIKIELNKENIPILLAENIAKLESSILKQITDEADRKSFKSFIESLFHIFIQNGPYKNKEDLFELSFKIAKITEGPKLLAQYTAYTVVSPKKCREEFRELENGSLPNVLCGTPVGPGRVCSGDSGAPAAVPISGKYYLAGVSTLLLSKEHFLLIPLCTVSNNSVDLDVWEDIKPHVNYLKEKMKKKSFF